MDLIKTIYFSLNLFRFEKSLLPNVYVGFLILSLFFTSQKLNSQTQNIEVKLIHIQTGIGYPFSLTDQKQYFDAHLNFGLLKNFNQYYSGFLFGGHYRQSVTNDYSISSKIRIGKLITSKHNISIDVGHSLYSKKHKKMPGFTFGLNIEKTNDYGIHLRFDEFSGNHFIPEKNLILGLNVTDDKVAKIALPIIGGTLVVVMIFGVLISGSR